MTPEEIIYLVRKIGGLAVHDYVELTYKELQEFAKLIAAAEREACAKVCESHGSTLANGAMLAEAIRARGEA